ncbi:alpha/beta hydrolase [Streptococcus pneumoniae]
MEERFIRTKIGEVYTTFRQGNPTILFLSGMGFFSTADNFRLVIEKLPEEIGILTIDLPNTGKSKVRNQANDSIKDVMTSLSQLIKDYSIENYGICAHSISGILALKLFENDSSCRFFVGIEPTTREILYGNLSKNPYPEFQALEEQLSASEKTFEDYLRELSELYFSPQDAHQLWQTYHEAQDKLALADQAPIQAFISIEEKEISTQMPSDIAVILFCQEFRVAEYERSEYVHPDSDVTIVAGGDFHYLHWSESEKIANYIKNYMEKSHDSTSKRK